MPLADWMRKWGVVAGFAVGWFLLASLGSRWHTRLLAARVNTMAEHTRADTAQMIALLTEIRDRLGPPPRPARSVPVVEKAE